MKVGAIDALFALTLVSAAVLVLPAEHSGRLNRESQAANNLEQRIRRVELGLVALDRVKGETPTPKSLIERMHHYKVPGVSIAVIDNEKIDWSRGYGLADTATGQTVEIGTRFQAASISKPVTAMAALHFVEEGKLALDEDVNQRLVSWKVPPNDYTKTEKVTLRRILSHSAGFTVHVESCPKSPTTGIAEVYLQMYLDYSGSLAYFQTNGFDLATLVGAACGLDA